MFTTFLLWFLTSVLPLVFGTVSGFYHEMSSRTSAAVLYVAAVIEAFLLWNFWSQTDVARGDLFFAGLLWMFCAGVGIRAGEWLWGYIEVTRIQDELALPTSIRGND